MALSHSRHLLVWTTLPIAVLLSYLWFKKKRAEVQSDPKQNSNTKEEFKSIQEELQEAEASTSVETSSLTRKPFSRSLSGIDSAPIDIIFPPELRSSKSAQIIISDEDLDIEIEKIKSMKNSEGIFSLTKKTEQNIVVQPKTPEKLSQQVKVIEKPVTKILSPKIATGSLKKTYSPIKKSNTSIPEEVLVKTEMAQKDIVAVSSLEKKIQLLKVDGKEQHKPVKNNMSDEACAVVTEVDVHRQSTERDSANHSPVDVMLASPSLSCISDSHSEGSSDSGKGRSEVATPPTRAPPGNEAVAGDALLFFEFLIPQELVGKLIGRYGSFVNQIKTKTRANILIKKYLDNNKLKLCSIEGTQASIDQALVMIRNKFPLKRFPAVTLEQITPLDLTTPFMPEPLFLKLVEGVNNDTIVSCMVAPNHLFLQQPTHPSFPNLVILSDYMNICYGDSSPPMLPNPISENCLCAAYSIGAWYRAIIISTDPEQQTSYLKFCDCGGYANVKNSELRQIRGDFVMLPFQAAECILYNIKPAGGEEAEWSTEAFNLVADFTKGAMVYTQIADYTEDEIPLVLIYVVVGPQQLVYLNEELVNRGFAEWINNPHTAVNGISH